jgi:hypothetical protein
MKVSGILTAVIGLSALFTTGNADAQYTYYGEVVARNSGTTCRASNATFEGWLRHNVFGAEVNPNMTGADATMPLYCPISRRNVSAYFVEPPSEGDKVDLTKVEVWVKHTPSGNLGKWLGCSVSAQGALTGSSYFSPTKYACATDGGCGAADTTTTGYRRINFDSPLGGPITGMYITNLVVGCSVPRGASVIGYVSRFNG